MLSEPPHAGVLTPSSLCVNTLNTYTWFVTFSCVEGELHLPYGTAQLKDGIRSNPSFPKAGGIIHIPRNNSKFEKGE